MESTLNILSDWSKRTFLLIEQYKKSIETCSYKNKDKYLKFLNSLEIPTSFEVQGNTVAYTIRGTLIKRTKRELGGKWELPITLNKSERGVLSAIASIASGKKQEALKITSKKRRLEDGTYKGTDKTLKTRKSKYNWSEVTSKIAKKRRMSDGYKNIPLKLTIEKIVFYLDTNLPGYKLLSETYKDNKKKLSFLCNKGHYFEMRWNNISNGQRCSGCVRYAEEEKTREIMEKVFGEIFVKIKPSWLINPDTGRRLELDGLSESIGVAFEYNGIFHYEMPSGVGTQKDLDKIKKKDRIKKKICKENKIFLITISYRIKDRESYIRKKHDKWLKLRQEKI